MIEQDTRHESEIDLPPEDGSLYEYKNKHKDERCVIIGNGPSLNKTNLDLLENEITFCLNKVFLLLPRLSFLPTYVVCYVDDIVRQHREEFKGLPMPLFVSRKGMDRLRDREFETHYLGFIRRFMFTMNPVKEIAVGHTVTYVALQLAFFMGFKKVILVGVDHDFGYDDKPDKWQIIKEPSKVRHFDENYFAPGQTWQSPNLERATAYFGIAKLAYESLGREVVDCTVEGKLDVFKKLRLEEVLR